MGHDNILRIKEIIPTDNEIKLFSSIKSIDLLNNETEKLIFQLTKILKCKEKVQILLFLNTWEITMNDILMKCQQLTEFTGKFH